MCRLRVHSWDASSREVAGEARGWVGHALTEWSVPDRDGEIALIVTELVTNSLRHAGPPISLTLAVADGFVDLTDLYSPRLRRLMREIDPTLAEGVYAQFPGPHYETPAEVRMARIMGADLVGMSTALEAIAARAEGSEVLGISLVTNLAAGMTGEPLNHEEVLAAGKAAAARAGGLLVDLLDRL